MLAHNALQCLTLLPGRHLTPLGVIDELIRLMNREGAPAHIRLETDPEFIAKAMRIWLSRTETGTPYAEPRRP